MDIAKEFNITPTTLATIIKQKEKYADEFVLSKLCKKAKKGELQVIEEAVVKSLKQCCNENLPIGGPAIQEKAQKLGHNGFCASNSWLSWFKKRH